MEADIGRICRASSPARIPLAVSWGSVMKAKDETASTYVMLEGIALHFGVQTATVKKRAADLGVKLVKVRKASSKNAYCAAVTAEDARRIAETFRAGNLVINARVLGPDEISKLMEEK